MSKENNAASAPVHQLVGQLRELMAKVHEAPLLYDTCVIASEAWCDQNGMIHYEAYGGPLAEGDPRTLRLCVAAVNALPALLAIAEAAAVVSSQRNGPYLMADMDATLKAESDLRTALSSLPNATIQTAPSGARLQSLVGCEQSTGENNHA